MSWRRILLLTALFVVALATATWLLLHRSDAATTFVARLIAEQFTAPTAVRATELDLARGRLSLFDLRLDDPGRPGTPLLRLDTVTVDIDPAASGATPHEIRVQGAHLDLGPRLPAPDGLLRPGQPGAGTATLPPITLEGGTVRWTPDPGQPAFELADLRLQLVPLPGGEGTFSVSGSASLSFPAMQVELHGVLATRSEGSDLRITLRGGNLDPATLRELGRRFGIDQPAMEAAAQLDELTLRLSPPDPEAADRAPVLTATGRLRGCRLAGPGLPRQIRNAAVTVEGTSLRDGEVNFRVTQQDEVGDLAIDVQVRALTANRPSWSLRAKGRDVRVDADACDALALFPLGKELIAALQPTSGRADIDLYLQDPERPDGLAEFDLDLREVRMAFHGFGEGTDRLGFPMPVFDASGHVRLRDDVVTLEGLRATVDPAAGGGRVQLDGLVETKRPRGDDTSLDIRAEGVEFNPRLRESVIALLHDDGVLYDRFAPTGRADVEVRVRPQQVLPGCWSFTLRPRAATMQWGGFPYRLSGLAGEVTAHALGVEFDLQGSHGEGRLHLRGHIPFAPGQPEPVTAFSACCDLTDVQFDDDLRSAVAVVVPPLEAPWRQSSPRGRVSGRVSVWRQGNTAPLAHSMQLAVAGVDLDLPCAPWRATGLGGQVLAQGDGLTSRISFLGVQGQLTHGNAPPAALAMLGTLDYGATVQGDLTYAVRSLQLDQQLGETLETFGAMPVGTWAALRPTGTIDLTCRHHRDDQGAERVTVGVTLLEVGSDADLLPKPARQMRGMLHIADGSITFQDVKANLGGAQVRCENGRISRRPAPDGRLEIRVAATATGFPVDDGLANLFRGPLRQAILDRHLRGRVDIEGLHLGFLLPAGDANSLETEIGGQLRLYDLAMALGTGPDGLRLEGIGGTVQLQPSRIGAAGGQLRGSWRRGAFRLFDQPFEAVDAEFLADAEQLQATRLRARLHGGTVRSAAAERPAVQFRLPGPGVTDGRLQADLAFERIDTTSFLQHCGWPNPPYSGQASGNLQVTRLDGNDVVDALGRGALRIEQGDLGAVPLFTAIYSQLPAPERPRFDALATEFELADRKLRFAKLALHSNLMEATGSGHLDLDGYLDVQLKLDNLLGPSADPLFMPLIDALTQGIVRFHLYGHLRDLTAEKRWLTEGAPSRRPVRPLPPLRERPSQPAR